MKRTLIVLLLGLLIFGVSFAGAKVANVTNPMNSNLNGNNYNIDNVGNYLTSAGAVFGGDGLSAWNVVYTTDQAQPFSCPCTIDFAGTADPSIAPPIGNNPVGSLYRQRIDSAHAALWFKTGPNATDWTQVVASP